MGEPPFSEKQLYKAVANYLGNELGVDRNYVDGILREKIEARNPEALVRQAVERYFRKGPSGYRSEEIVRERVNQILDARIRRALDEGVQEQLDEIIKRHVDAIVGGTPAAGVHGLDVTGIRSVTAVNASVLTDTVSGKLSEDLLEIPATEIVTDGSAWFFRFEIDGRCSDGLADRLVWYAPVVWRETVDGGSRDRITLSQQQSEAVVRNCTPLRFKRSEPVPGGVAFYGYAIGTAALDGKGAGG